MRKFLGVIAILLVIQTSYKIIPILAQGIEATFANQTPEDEDSLAIKKVIETFLTCFVQKDVDGLMSGVSKSYSATAGDQTIDYDKFKANNQNRLKEVVDLSISNLMIESLNVEGDHATAVATFNLKGTVLRTMKDMDTVAKRKYSLTKEDGVWKIVSVKMLRAG